MAYRVFIISPAKREIRKLDPPTRKHILASCLGLSNNPRPSRYRAVVGEENLYRIHAGKHRIIYTIQDVCEAVVVLTVRPKDKDTYRNIPVQGLVDKLKELDKSVSMVDSVSATHTDDHGSDESK